MRLMPLIAVGLLVGAGTGWWLSGQQGDAVDIAPVDPASVIALPIDASRSSPPTPEAVPALLPATATATAPADSRLLLPVQGVQSSQLQDTFTDARSEGRVHDAIDIMAVEGTPVLAVADGHVEKLFDSDRGGLTVYQFDPDGMHCYYYAHLQRYAEGLAEKKQIKRGDVIGYVGSTGNADPAAPHLHFEVHVLGPEKQWWKGVSINPYPLLTAR